MSFPKPTNICNGGCLCVTCWQIANLFDKYDEDGSGELDIPEMCKLLLESDVSSGAT